jgi:hypothetical protein
MKEEALMAVTATDTLGEVAVLRQQQRFTQRVVRLNVDGLTHEESLVHPAAGGNCMNWVVGHLTSVYASVLALLEDAPEPAPPSLRRYGRGTPPLAGGADAVEFGELLALWEGTCERMDAALARLTPEALDRPVQAQPGEPAEPLRALLATILFHQAYHAGQTGLLRRLAGREGAIR